MTVLWVNRGGTRLDRSEMTFLSWTLPLSSRLWGWPLSEKKRPPAEQANYDLSPIHSTEHPLVHGAQSPAAHPALDNARTSPETEAVLTLAVAASALCCLVLASG